ncbi:MAG: protein kinase [Anaerolineae bacterium]|nr:protein kinase [Anaerolineae bacterium]
MNEEISFGQIVKERRRALDLTQAELARRVACATITVRKIEADALRPSQQIAERLAMALNIPLDERARFVRLARIALHDTPEPSPLPTPPPTAEEIGGEDLSGRAIRGYELGERIGAGGFGAVYRGVQPLIEREVAVKIILPQYANHPDFIRRFEAEAQLVARLEHPYIVPLYDYWREPGVAYLVMRLLRGGSLGDVLKNGPLPLETVAVLLEQIGAALHAAHRVGVIHRDLKPANVLLDEDGNGYLADFGIAKNLSDPDLEDLTQVGAMIGSPAYSSPEQIRSEPVKPQADIYCLGILLYELLSGHKPFLGPTPIEYIMQHLNEPLPPLDGYPSLDPIIQRATDKNSLARYPDVPSLLADFRQAVAGDRSVAVAVDTVPYRVTVTDQELENPYKGLRPFGEADAEDFFGRETLVQELLGQMSEADDPAAGSRQDLARFVAVVGPSGSGKSSVVKAGLIPALRQGGVPGSENWFIVDLMPGTHPLEELEAALLRIAVNPPESLLTQLREDERGLLRTVHRVLPADPNVELMLVIDQFEEVFTQVADEETRAFLLDSLVTAVLDERSRLRVVVTLRADFTGRALEYVDFGELVRQRTTFVLPLTPEELEQAIVRPAARAGLAVEPRLVATAVQDVGDQPGILPLLQYALTELFERREGRTLTLAAYRESDGVIGALGRRAEELYANLDEASQEATRQLFLRLVTLGEGVADTRRRVLRTELSALQTSEVWGELVRTTSEVLDDVINLYGRYRLLTFDHDPVTRGPTVEVAHEALLREWGRLQSWLDESRADVRMQRLLAAATAEWDAAGREPSYLLRGTRLVQFEEWEAESVVALTQDERAYLEASQAERKVRQARERRTRNVLRVLQGFVGMAAVVAFALAIIAFDARSTAQQERDNAQREAAVNHSLVLAANAQQAQDNGEGDLALALALEAVTVDQPPSEAKRALSAIALGPGTRAVFKGHNDVVRSVAFSPDGKTALSGSCAEIGSDGACAQGELILWDLSAAAEVGTELRRFEGHTGWVNSVVFGPDGKTILSGSGDGALILWDVDTGGVIRRLEGHTGGINSVALGPDTLEGASGQTALSGSDDATLILWNVSTGEQIRRFEGHTGGVNSVAFSPDGQTALSGSDDTTLILWDVATGEAIHRFEGHINEVIGVMFNLDGRTMLSTGDHTLRLWDLATGEEIRQQHFGSTPKWLVSSPDGHTVLFGGIGFDVRLWDVERWQEVQTLLGGRHVDKVEFESAAISPDGLLALSGETDGGLRLWNLEGQAKFRRFETDGTPLAAVAVSPDGQRLLTGDMADVTVLWDVQRGEVIRRFAGDAVAVSPNSVAFSPDGKYALVGSGDAFGDSGAKSLVLWDIETGREIRRFEGHRSLIRSVAFSPDGRMALSGSQGDEGNDLILWDISAAAETGEQVRRFDTDDDITSIVFSADGSRALTGSVFFSNLTLWDVATGQQIRRFEGPIDLVFDVAFGPDEKTVLSASGDGSLTLWDVETGDVIRRYLGHDSWVWSLDVSPDGRYVLSSSEDGAVILWDFETAEELRRFKGHTALVPGLVFSPDGQTAFSVSLDGALIEWQIADLPLDELIEWTHANRYVRDLTCDERAQYRVEPLCE